MLHVHIGLGKLGLGCVVPVFGSDLLATIPTGGATEQHARVLGERGRYLIEYSDGTTGHVAAPRLAYFDRTAEAFLACLNAPPSLVSCSVGPKHLPTVYEYLDRLVAANRAHYRAAPLIFLPMENDRHAGRSALEHLRRGDSDAHHRIVPLSVLVDRICPRIRIVDGECVVTAEKYMEVRLTPVLPEHLPVLMGARVLPESTTVLDSSTFEYHVKRKYWCLNGMHYVLALAAVKAHLSPRTTVGQLLGAVDRPRLARILTEITLATYDESRKVGRPYEEAESYAQRCFERIQEQGGDTVERLITPLVDLMEEGIRREFGVFFDKWERRILEPTDVLLRIHQGITWPLALPTVNFDLLRVLGEVLATGLETPAA